MKHICVTGAAGQIAYSLLFKIANGDMFGPNEPIVLHLLEIPPALNALQGVVMELQDGAFPLLHSVIATSSMEEAFTNVDLCILVGAFPRRKGMLRKDLLEKNVGIFQSQGKAIASFASPQVRILVVGNPANTNCLAVMESASSLPKDRFSALTRLDQNRATSLLARTLEKPISEVSNVIIWGNHSSTQFPDIAHATVSGNPASDLLPSTFNHLSFIETVQKRGAAILEARSLSSAASASKAIVDHIVDWYHDSNGVISMAICSDGSYGIAEGLIFSFPVRVVRGSVEIVQGLTVSKEAQERLDGTEKELKEERDLARKILAA